MGKRSFYEAFFMHTTTNFTTGNSTDYLLYSHASACLIASLVKYIKNIFHFLLWVQYCIDLQQTHLYLFC
jgi:hypothetical protein